MNLRNHEVICKHERNSEDQPSFITLSTFWPIYAFSSASQESTEATSNVDDSLIASEDLDSGNHLITDEILIFIPEDKMRPSTTSSKEDSASLVMMKNINSILSVAHSSNETIRGVMHTFFE